MKKAKKILVLLLTFVMLGASFAFVAAASDGDGKTPQVLGSIQNYNAGEVGEIAPEEANPNGEGQFITGSTDNNPDKFIEHTVLPGTGNASYLSNGYKCNKKYSFAEYPRLAMDIDIMKVGADYAGAGLSGYWYAYGTYFDQNGNQGTANGENDTGGNVMFNLSLIKEHLPKDTHEWVHLTIVFEYYREGTNDCFNVYAYINGEQVFKRSAHLSVQNTKYTPDMLHFGTFRLNNAGTVSTENKSGYDNWRITAYPESYSLDEIAREVYNEDYELPFGKTVAMVGTGMFDNIPEAIEAANNGDTVYLFANAKAPVSIDKSIIVDTNVYDESGNPSGDRYKFEFAGGGNYIPATQISDDEDGIIEFIKANNASVKVYWDDCHTCDSECDEHPSEECGCTCMYPVEGHPLYEETTASIFSIPKNTKTAPQFEIKDGKQIIFLGWSYTKGASAPEELKPIDFDDTVRGYVDIYPVYKELNFSILLTQPGGGKQYYLGTKINDAFADAANGATITLLDDVTVYESIELIAGKGVTIDLNGNDLNIRPVYGNVYVNGELSETVANTAAYGFKTLGEYKAPKVTVTSTKSGAALYVSGGEADIYYDYSGTPVREDVKSVAAGTLFGGDRRYFTEAVFVLSNIDIYAGSVINTIWGGTTQSLTIENCNFYQTANKSFFTSTTEGEKYGLTVKNSKIFLVEGSRFIGSGTNANISRKTTYLFENTDIIGANNAINIALDSTHTGAENINVVFKNSRVSGVTVSSSNQSVVVMSEGTVFSGLTEKVTCASGCETVAYTGSENYSFQESDG